MSPQVTRRCIEAPAGAGQSRPTWALCCPQEPAMFPRRVLSLAALTLLPLPAYGAETLWKEIIVRVYDSTGAAADRRGALSIAASIVSTASVELIWRTC